MLERGAHLLRRVRRVGAEPDAARQRDLGRGRGHAGLRLLEVARLAAHQARDLLRAADAAALLVAHREGAVAGQAARPDRARRDALALHRLHGVSPDLAYASE